MTAVTALQGNSGAGSTTEKLHRLLTKFPDGRIALGAIVDELGSAGTGLCLLLLSLTALVPGIAPVFGVALCAIALGMVLGRAEPLVPETLRRRRLHRGRTIAGLQRFAPAIAWLERWLHPRATHLLRGAGIRLIGAASLVNGILIVLPIPFGNTAPAIAMLILSLGLVVGDGIAVGIGLMASVIALAIDVGLIVLGYSALTSLIEHLF